MDLKIIVVAPDSFKGSLSARAVAECCREGITEVTPQTEVVMLPLADGGEGTVDALSAFFGGVVRECIVSDPLGRKVRARYLVSEDGSVALMEMASASGLTLLTNDERNPLLTSTVGLGDMIVDALNVGCRNFFVGLGGSATNDGGMGMLRRLGYRFYDKKGVELRGCGADLVAVSGIDCGRVNPLLEGVRFTVACDVDNPMVGGRGAAAVYAPQKGADGAMVRFLEKGMVNFASVIKGSTGVDVAHLPGAGAAGGLGGAFYVFLKAEMRSGIEMVLDALHFDENISDADLIITGEGRIDAQSLMGKALSGVLRRGKKEGVPVVAIGGSVADVELLKDAGFYAVEPIQSEAIPLEEAMNPATASANIRRTIVEMMRLMCR